MFSQSSCSDGFVGIGVTIGTDAFVQNFVAKTCRAIIDDVEMVLSTISSSGFAKPPDSNILIATFCSVIDAFCNSNTLIVKLKKGTKQHADGWDAASKAWAHMNEF